MAKYTDNAIADIKRLYEMYLCEADYLVKRELLHEIIRLSDKYDIDLHELINC